MNYRVKIATFVRLCHALSSRAQESITNVHALPNASGPTLDIKLRNQLIELAKQLVGFEPENHPGVSVDVQGVKAAGSNLITAVDSGNLSKVLSLLNLLLNETQNGGGALHSTIRSLREQVIAIQSKTTIPSWLDRYVAKEKIQQKSPGWLDRYMTDQDTKENAAATEADSDIDGMQASLDNGSSVKVPK